MGKFNDKSTTERAANSDIEKANARNQHSKSTVSGFGVKSQVLKATVTPTPVSKK